MKGKHVKKETRKIKITAPIALIIVGLVMVVTALILEAGHYPWGLLFGTATQNEEDLPDPAPLVLDTEDAGADIVFEPEAETDVPPVAEPSQEPSNDAAAESAILPGDEEDTAEAPQTNQYVVLGVIKIPVLGVSQNLLEGSGKQMKYGVGHITGTAAPGQQGNCAVSGHRPYPFRYLDKLVSGDSVVIKTGDVTYTYTVYESFNVLPNEVWVLGGVSGEAYALTIITCTPYLVSSHRLIVRARLTEVNGLTPAEYYGTETPEATPEVSPEASPEASPEDVTASDPAVTQSDSAETSGAGTDTAPPAETSEPPVTDGSAEPSQESETPQTASPSPADNSGIVPQDP